MSALINFDTFINRVNHNGKVNLLVRKAMYLDNPCYHYHDRIKEGGLILSCRFLNNLSSCDIEPLGIIDGALTGLCDYSFYLAIGRNGTVLILQDLLSEKN